MSTAAAFLSPAVPGARLPIRRALRGAVFRALGWRSRPYPIADDTTALIIAPHPDDDVLGCGGLILLKRLEGATVRLMYLTDGSASHRGHPTMAPGALAVLRRGEAREGAAILGVDQAGIRFLDAKDGTLNQLAREESDDLIARIASALGEIRPDEIFLPCRRDGSSEHDAAFELVRKARQTAGSIARVFEFPIWSRWNPRLLVGPLLRSRRVWRLDHRGYESLKRRAIAAQASQVEPTPPWPAPVLSPEFVAFFSSPEEFFFEME